MSYEGARVYVVRVNGHTEHVDTYTGPVDKIVDYIFEVHGIQCMKGGSCGGYGDIRLTEI